jgi:hypothetical protein
MSINFTFSYLKEMRRFVNLIKNMGLEKEGIIYGGLVRDEIIGNHYREKFINKKLDFSEYWDLSYDTETNKRLIIPNDIDIFFKNQDNANDYIKNLEEFAKTYFGRISVKLVSRSQNMFNYINSNLKLKHFKVNISIIIGRTLSYSGRKLNLLLDIITVNNDLIIGDSLSELYMSNIEPPFYNLDFLCNIFVLQSINKKNIIRVSNCTGTPLDTMEFTKKSFYLAKVIADIVTGNTQFLRNDIHSNAEFINCYRIIKLIERPFPWNITNVPFKVFKSKDIIADIEDTCYICMDEIKLTLENKEKLINNKYVSITTTLKHQTVHFKCFMSYLQTEKNKRYINPDSGEIECRCPLRTPFNFKNCFQNVNFNLT